jgi:type III secretion system low calcium response chaperone LcrH/SycD
MSNPAAFQDPDALSKFLDEGGAIYELLGVTQEELDGIYAMAYQFLENNRFEEADNLFHLLVTYNYYNTDYAIGLGLARQGQGKLAEAADIYGASVAFNVNDPRLPFHAGECHFEMGNLDAAESGFTMAALRAEGQSEHAQLKTRAEALLEAVKAKQEGQSHE